MKASARISLVLAAALFGMQQAIACCCLADLLAQAQEPVTEAPLCGDCPDDGQAREGHGCAPECSECADFEPAPAGGAAKAIAFKNEPGFKLPPAISDHSVPSVRPQSVRIAGPPAAVARQAQTPVVLKQRLLI